MIFYKNILKKEKIISYIFLITIISLFSLGVIFVKDYLQVKQNKINNSIEKRTIIVDDIIECNNYMIEKCEYEDSTTKVLVKNIKNKEEVMKSIGENHFLYTDSSDIDKYDFFVDSMNILFCITLISFLVMLFTLIIQFNKDDEQTIKIMRCIGYSKIKVFTINYLILFSILCSIFIINSLIGSIVLICNTKFFNQRNIITCCLMIYGIILIISFISYFYMYIKLDKRRIRK